MEIPIYFLFQLNRMSSSSGSKKEIDIYKSLDNLYKSDKIAIYRWLDEIKSNKSEDGKVSGLLSKSRIQIITESDEGAYNLILRWLKENMDKFADYDFKGIPNSAFTSLDNTFTTVEDVKRWCKDPEVNPIKGNKMSVVDIEYYDIYEKAYKIMKREGVVEEDIITLFPKNHLLYGNIDLIYYRCVKRNVPNYDRLYENKNEQLALCKLLTEKIENTEEKDTVFETEIELLKNRFSNSLGRVHSILEPSLSNLTIITKICNKYTKDLVNGFFEIDYISMNDYPERMKALQEDVYNIEGFWFINFLEKNKLANGETILKYCINTLKKPNPPYWISSALKIYNNYKAIYKDIDNCYNPNSGVIKNIEDKKLEYIKDPIDDYFEYFEKKLKELKKPKYSQLIDLTTFKPKKNLKYLNDEQFSKYKKKRDKYDVKWQRYSERLNLHETSSVGRSPTPPKKPEIALPWGKHTIAKEIDPIHIRDDVIEKFREEYQKAEPIIEEYNKIKNMPYLELKRYAGSSPTSASKKIMKDNKLLSMSREEISENILFDYSYLADKCSENIDILTNEELDDANYPLSKLQLMVRLKVYNSDNTKYRTECIYAPILYNYLIKCINTKEPFVNPVTKTKYTQDNIDDLIKVMKIIDNSIEVPVFIEHKHDTKLKINHKTYETRIDEPELLADGTFGSINVLQFHKIYISRVIDGVEYTVLDLCHIPADIEATGDLSTGSADLTSSTMLFRIFKLFKDGRLLHNYAPPYHIHVPEDTEDPYKYIKPSIHFNKYQGLGDWLWNSNSNFISKEEFIEKFKHYAQEINNFIY